MTRSLNGKNNSSDLQQNKKLWKRRERPPGRGKKSFSCTNLKNLRQEEGSPKKVDKGLSKR